MKEPAVAGQPGVASIEDVAEALPEENQLCSNGSEKTIIRMNPDAQDRRVRELSNDFDRGTIVDKEKVKAIKAAVQAGTYHVDAERIAAKLLAIEGELERLHK